MTSQIWKPFTFPDVEATRCPKLDSLAKQLFQREQKQVDASLAKLQTIVLDTVAPLVHIVNEAQQGTLSVEQVVEAAKTALSLLGNAAAHVCIKRR